MFENSVCAMSEAKQEKANKWRKISIEIVVMPMIFYRYEQQQRTKFNRSY